MNLDSWKKLKVPKSILQLFFIYLCNKIVKSEFYFT